MYRQNTPQETNLEKILAKERTYNLIKIFLIIGTCVITIAYIGYQVNSATNKVKADNEKTRQYIACIVTFFAQPDRATKQITSIDSCKIETSSIPSQQSVAVLPDSSGNTLSSSFTVKPLTDQDPISQTKPAVQAPAWAVPVAAPTSTPSTPTEPVVQLETRTNPLTGKIEIRLPGDKLWQEK